MTTESKAVPHVYEAIRNVMKSIGAEGISKDRKNAQQGYQFRGIDDVYNALNPLLAEQGLIILPTVKSRKQEERATKSGGALYYTVVDMDFAIVSAKDGSTATISTVGEAMDSADKSTNKAMAAAYKYAAMMLFCIPTVGDNDADATTHEPQKKAPPAKTSQDQAAVIAVIKAGIDEVRAKGTIEDLNKWYATHATQIKAMYEADGKYVLSLFSDAKHHLTEKTTQQNKELEGAAA